MKRNHVFSIRNLVMMAALVAMQIILARFFSIQAGDLLRISFETIPLVLAGLWLGPINGAIVALMADILGTVISGYGTWFAPIALGPVMVAVLSGLSVRWLKIDLSSAKDTWKVVLTVAVAETINAFVIGPFTTTLYSMLVMGNTTAFDVLLWTNFVGRFTTKPFTIIAVTILVAVVNRTVYKPVIRQIVSRA